MPFTTDRDLLILQPTLFREVAWLAQTLHRGTLKVQSGELIAVTGAFPAAVVPGHVAVVDDRPLEITAITSSTSLSVSLTRAAANDPVITPADTATLPGSIATFDPQLRIIHDQLLRMLGLAPSQLTIDPLAPTESAIVNPRDLGLVEALGTLHLIYTSASASLAPDSALAQRAAHYQQRFAEERWRARAVLDLNNDGLADTTRALNVLHLSR